MQGKFYKIINDIDEKKYIGCTTQTLKQRFKGHLYNLNNQNYKNTKLYKHIKLLGKEHFKIILIKEESFETLQEMRYKERYFIELYDTITNGLNSDRPVISKEEEKIRRNKLTKKENENNLKNKRFYCELCDYNARCKSRLKRHFNGFYHKKKTGEWKYVEYKCDICDTFNPTNNKHVYTIHCKRTRHINNMKN